MLCDVLEVAYAFGVDEEGGEEGGGGAEAWSIYFLSSTNERRPGGKNDVIESYYLGHAMA
jgi:hypothetical protein